MTSPLENIESTPPTAKDVTPPMPDDVQQSIAGDVKKPQTGPEVKTFAPVAPDTPPTSAPESKGKLEQDKHGNAFDPAIHDAKRVLKKDGTFRLKRGRGAPTRHKTAPPKQPSSVNIPNRQGQGPTQAAPSPTTITNEAAAAQFAGLTVTMGMAIGGNDFKPHVDPKSGIDEMGMLTQTYKQYFDAKGGAVDLPPSMILLGGLAMYCLPRFQMPATKTRFSRFVAWAKRGFSDSKKKSKASKVVKSTKEADTAEPVKAAPASKLAGGNKEFAGVF